MAEIPNLKYTILRLPVVYGIGDKSNLMPRILAAAIYRELNKTMKLLWNENLKVNTVHVEDVCRAIVFLSKMDNSVGHIYNIVDDAGTTQGLISNLLADIFNIKVDYYGNVISACVDIDEAAEEANDRHLVSYFRAACYCAEFIIFINYCFKYFLQFLQSFTGILFLLESHRF